MSSASVHLFDLPSPQVGALKLLIFGFQRAHDDEDTEDNESTFTVVRNWTESFDWWLPVLGRNFSEKKALINELNKLKLNELGNLVGELAKFYEQPESSVKTFPGEIKTALCAFPCDSKCAA